MSITAIKHVIDHSKTKGSARVLMIVLADMANDDGECWPGKANLAKKINCAPRHVPRLVQECERLSELRVLPSAKDGESNRYLLVGLASEKRIKKARAVKPRSDRKFPAGGDTGVTSDSRVITPMTPVSLPPMTPVSPKPTIEPTTIKDAADAAHRPSKHKTYGELHPELSKEELDAQAAELSKIDPARNPLTKQAIERAIVAIRDYDPGKLTSALKGRIGKAVKDLHGIQFSADDIPALHQHILAKGFSSFTEVAYATYAPEWLAKQTPHSPALSPTPRPAEPTTEDRDEVRRLFKEAREARRVPTP